MLMTVEEPTLEMMFTIEIEVELRRSVLCIIYIEGKAMAMPD